MILQMLDTFRLRLENRVSFPLHALNSYIKTPLKKLLFSSLILESLNKERKRKRKKKTIKEIHTYQVANKKLLGIHMHTRLPITRFMVTAGTLTQHVRCEM